MSVTELADFSAFSEDNILKWCRTVCFRYPDGRTGAELVEKLGAAQRFQERVLCIIDVDDTSNKFSGKFSWSSHMSGYDPK